MPAPRRTRGPGTGWRGRTPAPTRRRSRAPARQPRRPTALPHRAGGSWAPRAWRQPHTGGRAGPPAPGRSSGAGSGRRLDASITWARRSRPSVPMDRNRQYEPSAPAISTAASMSLSMAQSSAERRLSSSVSIRAMDAAMSGPSTAGPASTTSARNQARCRERRSGASPLATRRSDAYWRIVSSSRYRVTAPCSATTSERSTRRPRPSRVASREAPPPGPGAAGVSAATAHAASSVQPPANTDRRRSRRWSASVRRSQLQSMRPWRVCCRGTAVRRPPVSSRKRSPRPCSISATDMTLTRAAASSMASGMPSSRRQMATTGPAVDASSTKPGAVAAARSTNSRTDSAEATASMSTPSASQGVPRSPSGGRSSDGIGMVASPSIPSASRLVVRIRRARQSRSSRSTSLAQASMTCSQLSSSSRRSFPRRNSTTPSSAGRPAVSGTPSARPTPSTTRPGSASGASSTSQAPSPWPSTRSPARCSISRVLPVPPTPTSVTSRSRSSAPRIWRSSRERPTNEVSSGGRFVRGHGRARPERLVGEARRDELVDPLGPVEVAQAVLPAIHQGDPGRQVPASELVRHGGDEDLPAVPDREQTGEPVEGGAEVVAIAGLHRPGMDRHPHSQGTGLAPCVSQERALPRERRLDGRRGAREDGEHAVPGRLEDLAAGILHRAAQEGVVRRERRGHGVAVPGPEPSAALDVAHEERCDERGGVLGHGR